MNALFPPLIPDVPEGVAGDDVMSVGTAYAMIGSALLGLMIWGGVFAMLLG